METGRLEAFSDGVFAIAITLLILAVGIMWVNHHLLFQTFARVDRPMLLLNILFFAVWMYGSRRLLRADADPRVVSGITRSYLPGAPLYATATLLAFVSPTASLIMFAAIALFYALSAALFGRDG